MSVRINKIIGPNGQRLSARDLTVKSYISAEGGK